MFLLNPVAASRVTAARAKPSQNLKRMSDPNVTPETLEFRTCHVKVEVRDDE